MTQPKHTPISQTMETFALYLTLRCRNETRRSHQLTIINGVAKIWKNAQRLDVEHFSSCQLRQTLQIESRTPQKPFEKYTSCHDIIRPEIKMEKNKLMIITSTWHGMTFLAVKATNSLSWDKLEVDEKRSSLWVVLLIWIARLLDGLRMSGV